MIIKGKHNEVDVKIESIDEATHEQLLELANNPDYSDSVIKVMPDTHAGKGCTIGLTMTLTDKATPNFVGVDIGCGVLVVKLRQKDIDFKKLDEVIRKHVPFGSNNNEEYHVPAILGAASFLNETSSENYSGIQPENLLRSVGTLGGGNHFIEVARGAKSDHLYLLIHTGSRAIGARVAKNHQRIAKSAVKKLDINKLVSDLKAQGRHKEIQSEIQKYKENFVEVNPEAAYLKGEDLANYLRDLKFAQTFAKINRYIIASVIMTHMKLNSLGNFDKPHNYIDLENSILRKGAQSAYKDEAVIIPINMRDGSILGIGKGNADWNYSAPHGAGRVLSRRKAKSMLDVKEFEQTMEGVFSTTVGLDTLDEAPMAYKSIDDIYNAIGETVEIKDILKPLYNFKASE